MKKVEMTVVFSVEVPDNTDVDDLVLDLDTDVVHVTTLNGDFPEDSGGVVLGYETTACDEV